MQSILACGLPTGVTNHWTGLLDPHIFIFKHSEVILVMSLKTKGPLPTFNHEYKNYRKIKWTLVVVIVR